jgi:hypothetical protein
MKANCCLVKYFVLIAILLVSLGACGMSHHPSDAVLVERFHTHQPDFEKLVAMLNQDKDVVRITTKSAFLKEGATRRLSKERVEEYRRLLKLLQLDGGVQRDQDGLVLIASMKGVVIANSAKSYLYTPKEPSPLVDSLDQVINKTRGDQKPIHMRISGNWYLDYESW